MLSVLYWYTLVKMVEKTAAEVSAWIAGFSLELPE